MPKETCADMQEISELKLPAGYVCEECLKVKGRWLHLRTCQTCGVTLCCDDSPSKHMNKHNHKTNHPVIISAEQGERWMWCYKDELFVEY
ncbi:MAG: hypothetical protein JWQ40_4600 [Segetibacter sp.]|nr:hypothetical protein [Segetibacter sp.]